MQSDESLTLIKQTSRDYKCPCGKTYLSYPALFTHIRNKHNGKAPGQIEKPKLGGRQRGRPPLGMKKNKEDQLDASKQTDSAERQKVRNQQTKTYQQNYEKLFEYLKEIVIPQEIKEEIWQHVSSFKEYEKFIDTSQTPQFKKNQTCIGIALTEFLKQISIKTVNWRFEQLLILFMLLLQYVIDQQNSTNVIITEPVQTMIEYMNPFINEHISDYSQLLEINQLWGLQIQNIQKIFLCFYSWLKMKKYTSFCITLLE